ncbi:hypothetical protein [Deinococcus altitudinis]|uniref:hypothetical protein n=1 Tax=Deinococcus altitudinis TaxID=468914 RepID=UPI00389268DA
MTRRQIIRFYLMASLKKRLWSVILPAVLLGIAAFVLTSSLHISLPVTFLTALCTTAGILWSSYSRHLELGDFPTDRKFHVDPH